MNTNVHAARLEEQEAVDRPDAVSYTDKDAIVICDRKNPNAWIRSDTWQPLEGTETVPEEDVSPR